MRSARGWSLVELILVMVIIGTLGVFIGPLVLRSLSAYDRTERTVAAYAKMRYAMERMAREMREIRRNPSDTTTFDIDTATLSATNVSFVKADGTQVVVSSSGSNVSVNYVGTGSGTLTDQVSLFELKYYRHDGTTETTAANNVELVQISLTLTDGGNGYSSRQRVALRTPQ